MTAAALRVVVPQGNLLAHNDTPLRGADIAALLCRATRHGRAWDLTGSGLMGRPTPATGKESLPAAG